MIIMMMIESYHILKVDQYWAAHVSLKKWASSPVVALGSKGPDRGTCLHPQSAPMMGTTNQPTVAFSNLPGLCFDCLSRSTYQICLELVLERKIHVPFLTWGFSRQPLQTRKSDCRFIFPMKLKAQVMPKEGWLGVLEGTWPRYSTNLFPK